MTVESKAAAERLAREPTPDDMKTIRGAEDEESKGIKAAVVMAAPKVLTAKVS